MDRLRKFIAEHTHEEVKVGDLHQETMSKKVVKPKFAADFPGAIIREGAEERAHEEGVLRTLIDTSNVGDQRWGLPQVDADWHALCQAIFQGVEEPEWEAVDYHCKDLHQAVKSKNSGANKKGKSAVGMKEAKDKGVDYYDTNHSTEIQTRAPFRLNLWAVHRKSPTAALAKALECLDQVRVHHLQRVSGKSGFPLISVASALGGMGDASSDTENGGSSTVSKSSCCALSCSPLLAV